MHENIVNFIDNIFNKLKKVNSFSDLRKLKQICSFNISEGEEILSETSRKKLLFKRLLLKLIKKTEEKLRVDSKYEKIRLNKVLLNKIYKPSVLNGLILKNSIINRNIGSIPFVFLKNINKKDRKSTAKKIFQLCADYSLDLLYRDYRSEAENNLELMFEERDSVMDNFQTQLSNIINNEVSFEYISRGHNGNVFKLTIEDKVFIYKCFFPYSYIAKYQHGKNAEPQFGYYASKKDKKFAKFYFGRVCSKYDYDGFVVAEYINNVEELVKKENKGLQAFCDNYLSIDYSETRRRGNMIASKIVDYGGLIEVIPELKDKNVRYMVKLVINNINDKHDEELMKYVWKMNSKHIETIKNGIKKFDNIKDYKKALKVIKKYAKHFPKNLYKDLMKIESLKGDYKYYFEEKLNLKEFFSSKPEYIKEKLTYYQMKYTSMEPNKEVGFDGYINANLYENKFIVINYNFDGIINIRFEELVNNEYKVLFVAENFEEYEKICSSFEQKIASCCC